MRTALAVLALVVWGALPAGGTPLASPALSIILPRGAQRGATLDLTFRGARLKDAREVFLYKKGVEVLELKADGDSAVQAKIRIAPDAPLGEHPMRLRTDSGITEARTFHVGVYPTLEEKEPNSEFASPQPIPFNVTITGVIQNEDVDYFRIEGKKGQRFTAEVEGMRLGGTLFDPYLAILDLKRFERAVSDDSALLLQDSVLSFVPPEDGPYILQLRDSAYGGSDAAHYRLHVGTFPRPLAAYPAGGKAGEEVEITFVGDPAGPFTRKVALPSDVLGRFPYYLDQDGLIPPSPNMLRVSDGPNVLENEPNSLRAQATPTDLPLPVALNGIIGTPGDEDWFRFKARKGETFEVRVHARDVRSPLDAVLEIHEAGGKLVGSDDDKGGPDPALRFSPGADGEFEVRVRDHLGRGGPDFVYRVEFHPVRAEAFTHIPAYDREPNGQFRQWVAVPKGNRFATWIRVNRSGFAGDVKLSFDGLPAGLTPVCDTILSNVDRVPVVFEAAADAAVAGSLADVIARPADPAVAVSGGFSQDINLVLGNPNNTVYYGTQVRKLAVAVTEEAPFRIRVADSKVPLVRSGSMGLKVVAERKDGFDKPINLRMLWNPPGVGSQNLVTIPAGQTEALYPINADGNAAARTWKIAVLGDADGGYGAIWVSSQLANLVIEDPYVALKFDMGTAAQGEETTLVGKLEQLRPFEGKAKATLLGLPPGVTCAAPEKEITREDKEISFTVKVDPKSPVGRHKTLFCQVLVPKDGETMAHNVGGGGILRINPPPKKAEASAEGKKKP